jgi:enoyl reductase-like protein
MPKQKIEGLIAQLHEKLTESKTSPEQEQMLAQLQSQLDEWQGPKPADGNIKTVAEELVEEIEEHHPKAARVVREIIESLGHLGV